jgi:hypothetical protein
MAEGFAQVGLGMEKALIDVEVGVFGLASLSLTNALFIKPANLVFGSQASMTGSCVAD